MQKTGVDEFGAVLLEIYRASAELPMREFQDAALVAVKRALSFDSSMWGTATYRGQGIDVHTIHLHEQPPEMLTAYEEIKHLDTAAAAMALQPVCTRAFDSSAWFAGRPCRAIRAYGDRFEQKHFFISARSDISTLFTQWVTLFRRDAADFCSETERMLLAQLAPHLMQALGQNRRQHLERLAHAPGPRMGGAVIADLRGMVYHATPAVAALLAAEWEDARPGSLPAPLLDALRAGCERFLGRTLVAEHHVERGLLFLRLRERTPVDLLTPRERQVATLVAQGASHKEIARTLGTAPATVRNQIQSIYAKLGIDSIAALAAQWRAVNPA